MANKTTDKQKAATSQWHQENREKHLVMMKAYNNRIRLQVLNHYSMGALICGCCSEKEENFLTIDHIHNDGAKHRRQFKGSVYQWLVKSGFPTGFQVLCMNCNFAKGMYGACPHKTKPLQC